MSDTKGTKRKILTAGIGIAAYTALEGLACGNPVAPACPTHSSCRSEPEPVVELIDAAPADAQLTPDAGVENPAP